MSAYKQAYLKALANLQVMLEREETRMLCLCSDPLAVKLWRETGFQASWADVDDIGGMYFIHRNSDTPDFSPYDVPISDALKELLDKKFPIERGLSAERRAYVMGKRIALAEKEIIKSNKLIFCFGSAYKPAPKPDDGRAVILINNQFIPTLKLSGYDSPISMFLGFPTAHLSMTDWRF